MIDIQSVGDEDIAFKQVAVCLRPNCCVKRRIVSIAAAVIMS